MARSASTLKTMRAISAALFLTVAGLVAVGIDQMRHWNILTGWELIAWSLVPLALLLGFALPVRCKVKRTNWLACGNWAYGLLFGCIRAAGHWHEKFAVRLRFPHKEVKPVERRQPKGSYALNYQPPRQRQDIKSDRRRWQAWCVRFLGQCRVHDCRGDTRYHLFCSLGGPEGLTARARPEARQRPGPDGARRTNGSDASGRLQGAEVRSRDNDASCRYPLTY
jgi:hypothetical protein